jgi:hypothetical protein
VSGDDSNNPVDAYLRRLPSELPDAGLRSEILHRHLQRRWCRVHLPPLAAAAVLAVCAIGLPRSNAPGVDPAPAGPIVLATTDSGWVELRSIDRRLQQAYLKGGTADAELDRLWSRRDLAQRQLQDAATGRPVQL